MSQVAHPNIVSLLAARVLPPGSMAFCMLPHVSRCALPLQGGGSCWLPYWVKCLKKESVAKDCALYCADYMLVMALEGENVAHKLHREVSLRCHCACMWYIGLLEWNCYCAS